MNVLIWILRIGVLIVGSVVLLASGFAIADHFNKGKQTMIVERIVTPAGMEAGVITWKVICDGDTSIVFLVPEKVTPVKAIVRDVI